MLQDRATTLKQQADTLCTTAGYDHGAITDPVRRVALIAVADKAGWAYYMVNQYLADSATAPVHGYSLDTAEWVLKVAQDWYDRITAVKG